MAKSQLVRIDAAAHRALVDLRRRTGETSAVILNRALEGYRRERFFDELDESLERLRADPKADAEERSERRLWDRTAGDGLADKAK
jgi:hypothetical protein